MPSADLGPKSRQAGCPQRLQRPAGFSKEVRGYSNKLDSLARLASLWLGRQRQAAQSERAGSPWFLYMADWQLPDIQVGVDLGSVPAGACIAKKKQFAASAAVALKTPKGSCFGITRHGGNAYAGREISIPEPIQLDEAYSAKGFQHQGLFATLLAAAGAAS